LTSKHETKLMARVAAAIWGSIGVFGLLATVEPLRADTVSTGAMRPVAACAALIAALLLATPPRYLTPALSNPLVLAMTVSITTLAYAGGAVHGDLTILYTFVVVFAAYFLPPQVSAAHLGVVVIMLASRLIFIDQDASQAESVRFAILFPALVSLWGLVALLRKGLAEREARLEAQEIYDPETGLLAPKGLQRTLDPELARAMRHGRPLSLLFVEVSGRAVDEDEPSIQLVTTIARAIVGRIRVEDRAARVTRLRFAVVAIETSGHGVAALGRSLAEQIRKRVLALGYESGSFLVSVGWSDGVYEEMPREQMLAEAEHSLASAAATGDGIALPRDSKAPAPPPLASRPVADGVGSR
jgi:GGDEF domain-containing protein